jgi:iron complex transport system ATP-binding protein
VEVFGLLATLAARGYGVCVVTHDLTIASRFCHTVYLFGGEGRILDEGAPDAVFTEARLSEAYSAAIRVARHPLDDSIVISADAPVSAP